ncbi:hypothetical protein C1I95_24380 [Micromonospora craterilacus]|uniref:Uncharacterized protein n=1 Tax=Micromonospora craterilacus TaxID=1655439 RepID=A0A2W2E8Q6_9ACTN|nr:hypothetical protein C1I95_24380 [Micromonospora craterilacus]
MPEVQRLIEQGWELAPDAPMLAFLPAVWPAGLRTWVPDRSMRYEQRWTTDPATGETRSLTAQSSTALIEEVENDIDALLAKAGILDRPRGRIWLLKPPAGFASLDAFLQHVGHQADAAGIDGELTEAYVAVTARCLTESP